MKDISHAEVMAEVFRADPDYAVELFVEVVGSGQIDEIAIFIRYIEIALARSALVE